MTVVKVIVTAQVIAESRVTEGQWVEILAIIVEAAPRVKAPWVKTLDSAKSFNYNDALNINYSTIIIIHLLLLCPPPVVRPQGLSNYVYVVL